MNLAHLFRRSEPAPDALPGFIRAVEELGGVRVLRLQGRVGKDIAAWLRSPTMDAHLGDA